MASERFQLRKYLRQVRAMQDDFWDWRCKYEYLLKERPEDLPRAQMRKRIELLERLHADTEQLWRHLEQLPRLS